MTTQTSPEHVRSCLTRLRIAFPSSSTDTQNRIDAQNELFSRDLTQYHPQAVQLGCERAAREFDSFPTLKQLLPLVSGEQRALEDKRSLPRPGQRTVVERIVARHGGLALTRLDPGALSKLFDLNLAGQLSDARLDERVTAAQRFAA